MKIIGLMAVGVLMTAGMANAQDASAPVTNPVSATVKQQLPRFEKNMVGAAEAMPAEKYNFKPTPEMNTFGHLVLHITQANNSLCSKISGAPAPDVKTAETDGKDKLVAALKASFEFCTRLFICASTASFLHRRSQRRTDNNQTGRAQGSSELSISMAIRHLPSPHRRQISRYLWRTTELSPAPRGSRVITRFPR